MAFALRSKVRERSLLCRNPFGTRKALLTHRVEHASRDSVKAFRLAFSLSIADLSASTVVFYYSCRLTGQVNQDPDSATIVSM